jgi:hypothetical protein
VDTLSPRDLVASYLSPNAQPRWPADTDVTAFLTSAAADGVVGLLYARVRESGAGSHLPPALVEGLRAGALRQAATEMAQRLELQRLVAAIDTRGLDALLMKGASLAYDVYPDPAWRVRSDVDILIRADCRAAVRVLLHELGYVSFTAVSGEFAVSQFQCERVAPAGLRHLCDVHWKIVNRLRVADAVRFDELAGAAIALPILGPAAAVSGACTRSGWPVCIAPCTTTIRHAPVARRAPLASARRRRRGAIRARSRSARASAESVCAPCRRPDAVRYADSGGGDRRTGGRTVVSRRRCFSIRHSADRRARRPARPPGWRARLTRSKNTSS